MTLEIKSDAQAQAVAISKEKLWMFIDFICSRNLESILGQELLQRYNDDHDALRAALAAYEAQKAAIVLSEEELLCLKWRSLSYRERGQITKKLMERQILTDDGLYPSDAGRAYLAQKPMRWEVWGKPTGMPKTEMAFKCACDCQGIAENIAQAFQIFGGNTFIYEVREVR